MTAPARHQYTQPSRATEAPRLLAAWLPWVLAVLFVTKEKADE